MSANVLVSGIRRPKSLREKLRIIPGSFGCCRQISKIKEILEQIMPPIEGSSDLSLAVVLYMFLGHASSFYLVIPFAWTITAMTATDGTVLLYVCDAKNFQARYVPLQ